jgi:hypothetical protein
MVEATGRLSSLRDRSCLRACIQVFRSWPALARKVRREQQDRFSRGGCVQLGGSFLRVTFAKLASDRFICNDESQPANYGKKQLDRNGMEVMVEEYEDEESSGTIFNSVLSRFTRLPASRTLILLAEKLKLYTLNRSLPGLFELDTRQLEHPMTSSTINTRHVTMVISSEFFFCYLA